MSKINFTNNMESPNDGFQHIDNQNRYFDQDRHESISGETQRNQMREFYTQHLKYSSGEQEMNEKSQDSWHCQNYNQAKMKPQILILEKLKFYLNNKQFSLDTAVTCLNDAVCATECPYLLNYYVRKGYMENEGILKLGKLVIGIGKSSSKNETQQNTHIHALKRLKFRSIEELLNMSNLHEIESNSQINTQTDMVPNKEIYISDFVVMETNTIASNRVKHAVSILHISVFSNRMDIRWNTSMEQDLHKVTVYIHNKPIGSGLGTTKTKAKKNAACDALFNYLYRKNEVLQITQEDDCEVWIPYSTVMFFYEQAKRRGASSIVSNQAVRSAVIQQLVDSHGWSELNNELIFGPGLSVEHAEIIQFVGEKRNLSFRRKKHETGDYYVLRRNQHPIDIVKYLKRVGGCAGKYRLVPKSDIKEIQCKPGQFYDSEIGCDNLMMDSAKMSQNNKRYIHEKNTADDSQRNIDKMLQNTNENSYCSNSRGFDEMSGDCNKGYNCSPSHGCNMSSDCGETGFHQYSAHDRRTCTIPMSNERQFNQNLSPDDNNKRPYTLPSNVTRGVSPISGCDDQELNRMSSYFDRGYSPPSNLYTRGFDPRSSHDNMGFNPIIRHNDRSYGENGRFSVTNRDNIDFNQALNQDNTGFNQISDLDNLGFKPVFNHGFEGFNPALDKNQRNFTSPFGSNNSGFNSEHIYDDQSFNPVSEHNHRGFNSTLRHHHSDFKSASIHNQGFNLQSDSGDGNFNSPSVCNDSNFNLKYAGDWKNYNSEHIYDDRSFNPVSEYDHRGFNSTPSHHHSDFKSASIHNQGFNFQSDSSGRNFNSSYVCNDSTFNLKSDDDGTNFNPSSNYSNQECIPLSHFNERKFLPMSDYNNERYNRISDSEKRFNPICDDPDNNLMFGCDRKINKMSGLNESNSNQDSYSNNGGRMRQISGFTENQSQLLSSEKGPRFNKMVIDDREFKSIPSCDDNRFNLMSPCDNREFSHLSNQTDRHFNQMQENDNRFYHLSRNEKVFDPDIPSHDGGSSYHQDSTYADRVNQMSNFENITHKQISVPDSRFYNSISRNDDRAYDQTGSYIEGQRSTGKSFDMAPRFDDRYEYTDKKNRNEDMVGRSDECHVRMKEIILNTDRIKHDGISSTNQTLLRKGDEICSDNQIIGSNTRTEKPNMQIFRSTLNNITSQSEKLTPPSMGTNQLSNNQIMALKFLTKKITQNALHNNVKNILANAKRLSNIAKARHMIDQFNTGKISLNFNRSNVLRSLDKKID